MLFIIINYLTIHYLIVDTISEQTSLATLIRYLKL